MARKVIKTTIKINYFLSLNRRERHLGESDMGMPSTHDRAKTEDHESGNMAVGVVSKVAMHGHG